MKARIAACAVSASAVIYASTVFGYSAALRSSSERSALLERARNENSRLIEGSEQMENVRSALAAKLRRLTLVTDSRTFERLLQRIAFVARRAHVDITGLVPDPGESRDAGSAFKRRGLAIRVRGTFAGALTFVRLLPEAGILLRIRDVALTERAGSSASGALDVALRVALLRPADDWFQSGSR